MNDLEKVVQGIVDIMTVISDLTNKTDANWIIRRLDKAVAALKAQEPKVLSLEELKKSVDCPCWFESHGTYMGKEGFWIIPYMFSAWGTMSYVFPLMQTDERGNTHYSELGLYVYGKVWRCWTSKPTVEQREETPWE